MKYIIDPFSLQETRLIIYCVESFYEGAGAVLYLSKTQVWLKRAEFVGRLFQLQLCFHVKLVTVFKFQSNKFKTSFLKRVRKIAKIDWISSHLCLSVCPSAWNISAPTGRIFMKFNTWVFSENLSRKSSFHWNLTISDTLYEDLPTSMIISRSILLKVRNFPNKLSRENQTTYFMFKIVPTNHAVYEIMWENEVEPDRPQMTIQYNTPRAPCTLDN